MRHYLTTNDRKNYGLDFFDEAFGDFFRPMFYDEKFDSMKTDIRETENSYVMEIEMPGFDKNEISVNLENGYLTVSAQKSEKENSDNKEFDKKDRYVRKERSVSCTRSFYVGDFVDENDITAKYENGMLLLTVPHEEVKKISNKKIEIK